MTAEFVQWHLTGDGYKVVVYDSSCQPIEDYWAGDHPLCSASVAPKGRKVPKRTLCKWARQTALERAAEHKLPASKVSRDWDSESA